MNPFDLSTLSGGIYPWVVLVGLLVGFFFAVNTKNKKKLSTGFWQFAGGFVAFGVGAFLMPLPAIGGFLTVILLIIAGLLVGSAGAHVVLGGFDEAMAGISGKKRK